MIIYLNEFSKYKLSLQNASMKLEEQVVNFESGLNLQILNISLHIIGIKEGIFSKKIETNLNAKIKAIKMSEAIKICIAQYSDLKDCGTHIRAIGLLLSELNSQWAIQTTPSKEKSELEGLCKKYEKLESINDDKIQLPSTIAGYSIKLIQRVFALTHSETKMLLHFIHHRHENDYESKIIESKHYSNIYKSLMIKLNIVYFNPSGVKPVKVNVVSDNRRSEDRDNIAFIYNINYIISEKPGKDIDYMTEKIKIWPGVGKAAILNLAYTGNQLLI